MSAQSVYTLQDRSTAPIDAYALLPDHGYTLDKVRTDTTLRFIRGDSLRPASTQTYWLRLIVVNPAYYDESYNLSIQPSLNNTLYTLDAGGQQWRAHQAGADAPFTGQRDRNLLTFIAKGQTQTVLYVKIDVRRLQAIGRAVKPVLAIERQSRTNKTDQFMMVTWIMSLSVLVLFFLNNLFIYANFNDRIVLYYLLAQVGGMIYITDYKQFFNVLFPCPVFTVGLSPAGEVHYFDLGNLLQHSSIVLILYGQAQLTRAYLNTSVTLPTLDSVIKYGLYTYALLSSALMVINSCFFYLEDSTLWYHNIVALALISSIMYTCVIGYIRNLPAATPFLLANSLPLAFMLATALFHVFISFKKTEPSLLPDLASITHALAFSIALVARTKFIQNELAARTVETRQLEFEMREMALQHRLAELENQRINADIRHEKTKNELLQERLEINQRELASTTLYIVQKNELLASLKTQLQTLHKQHPTINQQGLKGIESILQSNLYLDADWGKFKIHFEQIHPDFFDNLLTKHPSLTKYEIRLYAYFHINLSTKEIAALLNIDPASVRRAKTRLYKKMALSESNRPSDSADQ
ncbi:hypothetical protein GCM10028825_53510 [Spirosoma agri]